MVEVRAKQMELLLSFLHIQKTEPEVSRGSLLKKSGASDAQLKALITKNILVAEQRPVDRLRVLPRHIHISFDFVCRTGSCPGRNPETI